MKEWLLVLTGPLVRQIDGNVLPLAASSPSKACSRATRKDGSVQRPNA